MRNLPEQQVQQLLDVKGWQQLQYYNSLVNLVYAGSYLNGI